MGELNRRDFLKYFGPVAGMSATSGCMFADLMENYLRVRVMDGDEKVQGAEVSIDYEASSLGSDYDVEETQTTESDGEAFFTDYRPEGSTTVEVEAEGFGRVRKTLNNEQDSPEITVGLQ
jgi:hypothetical protein